MQRVVQQLASFGFIALLLIAFPTSASHAAQPVPLVKNQEQVAASPSEAAAIARQRYGGEVLKVKKAGKVYKVRLLTPDGRVKEVKVAAK